MMISAVTDGGTGFDARAHLERAVRAGPEACRRGAASAWWSRIAATPPASMPMTSASPVVLSYVTVCAMLTMSAGAGSRAGIQVDGDDQAPLAALRIVGFAAKFGRGRAACEGPARASRDASGACKREPSGRELHVWSYQTAGKTATASRVMPVTIAAHRARTRLSWTGAGVEPARDDMISRPGETVADARRAEL